MDYGHSYYNNSQENSDMLTKYNPDYYQSSDYDQQRSAYNQSQQSYNQRSDYVQRPSHYNRETRYSHSNNNNNNQQGKLNNSQAAMSNLIAELQNACFEYNDAMSRRGNQIGRINLVKSFIESFTKTWFLTEKEATLNFLMKNGGKGGREVFDRFEKNHDEQSTAR